MQILPLLLGMHIWMAAYFALSHYFTDWVAFFCFAALMVLDMVKEFPELSHVANSLARISLAFHAIGYSFVTFCFCFFTMRFSEVWVWWQVIAIILPHFGVFYYLPIKRKQVTINGPTTVIIDEVV